MTSRGDGKTAVGLRVMAGLLASLVLAACDWAALSAQVDGWSIGATVPCAPVDARCQQMIEVATKVLDERDSQHPPVASVSVHEEGMYPNDDGSMGVLISSGGPPTIIVFVLADGSRRAIGVKYVLNDDVPTAFGHGPERRGGRGGDQGPVETP